MPSRDRVVQGIYSYDVAIVFPCRIRWLDVHVRVLVWQDGLIVRVGVNEAGATTIAWLTTLLVFTDRVSLDSWCRLTMVYSRRVRIWCRFEYRQPSRNGRVGSIVHGRVTGAAQGDESGVGHAGDGVEEGTHGDAPDDLGFRELAGHLPTAYIEFH
jgi:hypothetical protein